MGTQIVDVELYFWKTFVFPLQFRFFWNEVKRILGADEKLFGSEWSLTLCFNIKNLMMGFRNFGWKRVVIRKRFDDGPVNEFQKKAGLARSRSTGLLAIFPFS